MPDAGLICSARGCRNVATFDLHWRNPRLHDAARVKHWLACDEHADHLVGFLSRRGFLLARAPLSPSLDERRAPDDASPRPADRPGC